MLTITEQAVTLAIGAACRALRLPTVRAQADALAEAAARDRLTYRAHVIETGSASYRLRATERARKGGAARG